MKNQSMILWTIVLLLVVGFGFTACSGGDDDDVADDDDDISAADDDDSAGDNDDDTVDGDDDDNDDDDTVSFEEVDVFIGRQGGYRVYRIPSIIETNEGTLLAFCEGRQSISDTGNIDLVMKRSFDNGRTWTDLQVVVDNGEDTAGNPAPVVDRFTGTIWLPFNTNPAHNSKDRRTHITKSLDDGETWSEPTEITDLVKPEGWTWYAVGPGRSIQLESGRFIVPCDHHDSNNGTSASHVIYSDDGVDWRLGGILGPDTDESQVVQLEDGSLLINMRDLSDEHRRAIARSNDEGLTWTETTRDEALVDPSCQGSLLQTPYGVLFSNPASNFPLLRHKLTVRLSLDGGETWAFSKEIHRGGSAYSALSLLPDGRLGCLYENGILPFRPYDRITLAVFSIGWLLEGQFQD